MPAAGDSPDVVGRSAAAGNLVTAERLPWRRHHEVRGFIAHPEGGNPPGRYAEVRYEATSSTKWRWSTKYDLASAGGLMPTSQEAADAATAAWPRVKAEAAELAQKAADDDALRTLVRRQCDKGDLPLSAFEIETSSAERLRAIIWLIRDRGPGPIVGPAKPLADACSAELFKRRTAGDVGE
jgi:hypothetical protein